MCEQGEHPRAAEVSRGSRGAVVSRLTRIILIGIGTFSLALGIVGIFVPLLPTTPLLLLAAVCYARCSRRFYSFLITNRFFGNYVRNYIERRGIPLRVKVLSLLLLWVTVGLSAAFAVDALWVRILLAVIAVGVTVHIISLRTLDRQDRHGPVQS